ncbi:MAG: hypothetical protein V4659_12680 [Pseudomonadota bacterium]
MDAFSYLSVLLSIILGLAMTQVLQGYRALLLSRQRVRFYLPPLAWSAYILIIATQSWWSSFGLAGRQEWSFLTFAIILLQTILLYMAAALVLPDVPAEQSIDLKAHYFREATPFYAMMLAVVLVSLSKGILLDGQLPKPAELIFHLAFAGLSLVGLINRREWVHFALVVLTGGWIVSYIALLFARL